VTLSNLVYPEGIDDGLFRSTLAEEGIIVAGGLAAYAGKMFRLGHMGNIDMHDLVSVLATIERSLYRVGYPVTLGSSVGSFMKAMLED
jgi:aspartate aminotransferase-like enzyme